MRRTFPARFGFRFFHSSRAPLKSFTGVSAVRISSPLGLVTPYRFRGHLPGSSSQRWTHEERLERIYNKQRVLRESRQDLIGKAESYLENDVPIIFDGVFETFRERASAIALRVTNLQKCFETITVEIGGRKVPLIQVASIGKISPTELVVTPQVSGGAAAIAQRLMRFDSSLAVTKEGHKIRIVIQQLTTERRQIACSEIDECRTAFSAKCKNERMSCLRDLKDIGVDGDALLGLTATLDEYIMGFIADKQEEFLEIKDQVVTAGLDESDDAIRAEEQLQTKE